MTIHTSPATAPSNASSAAVTGAELEALINARVDTIVAGRLDALTAAFAGCKTERAAIEAGAARYAVSSAMTIKAKRFLDALDQAQDRR